MKKGKRLLVLLIVLAVFCAGAVGLNLYTRSQEEQEVAEDTSEATVLLTTATDNVTALSYTLGGEEIQLAKQGDAWVYAPRESFPLDDGKVTSMLSALEEISAVRTVSESADNLSDYGLEAPQLRIAATLADGTVSAVSVGDKNGVTGDYYVRVDGKDGVYTVGSDLYNAFDNRLMGLITSEAFPTVEASAVTALEWSDGAESKALEYHPDGDASLPTASDTWLRRSADGTLSALDADAVSDYLDSVTGLSYASCVSDTKDDAAAYGLDQPSLTLTLYYSEEVPQSQAAAELAAEAALADQADAAPADEPTATPTAMSTVSTAAPEATATSDEAATDMPTAMSTDMPEATAALNEATVDTPTAAPEATNAPTEAPTATPTQAVSGGMASAPADEADVVPTDEPTATPTATPEPMVSIGRTLTLWLGGTDENDNVYLTHSQTDRVFAVSASTAQTLLGLTDESLRSASVVSLQRAELEGLDMTVGDQRKSVGVVRTESTDADGNTGTSTAYTLDGGEWNATSFGGLFNDLFGLSAEAFTDQPVAVDAQAAFTAVIRTNRAGFEALTLELFPYDGSFYQARFEGDASRLVNKRDVEALLETFASLAQAEPTAEPTATPEPVAETEPVVETESITAPETIADTEPTAETELVAETEPINEPETIAETESAAE